MDWEGTISEMRKLSTENTETLNCEYGNPTCECHEDKSVCIFNLEIDEIRTFTSYQKLSVDEPTGIAMRGSQGVIYYFEDDGSLTPLQDDRTCSKQKSTNCTHPCHNFSVNGICARLMLLHVEIFICFL